MIFSISSRKDKESREKYMGHCVNNQLVQSYINMGNRGKILSLPVCPKCEQVGLRDRGWIPHHIMTCPNCGYHGPATHQLSAYLSEGCYR